MSAGPLFKFTPAVSFLVAFRTKGDVEHCGTHSRTAARRSWSLAPIPSAKDTGGVQDKYGVVAGDVHGRAGDTAEHHPDIDVALVRIPSRST